MCLKVLQKHSGCWGVSYSQHLYQHEPHIRKWGLVRLTVRSFATSFRYLALGASRRRGVVTCWDCGSSLDQYYAGWEKTPQYPFLIIRTPPPNLSGLGFNRLRL